MPNALQLGSLLQDCLRTADKGITPEITKERLLMARTPQEHAEVLRQRRQADALDNKGLRYFNTAVDGVLGRGFKDRVRHPRRDFGRPQSATDAMATALHFALAAASAPLVIPTYRAAYGCLGRGRMWERRRVRNQGWRLAGRALAFIPATLSEGAALLGAGLKAAPLGVALLSANVGKNASQHRAFVPLQNQETMVMQEPLDSLPGTQIFVTSDRWQFDVDELFACLMSREDFVNPLSLEPLSAQDLARLAKHPRCPPSIASFLSDQITVSTETVRRLLALSNLLALDEDANIGNPRSVLAMGCFSVYYNTLTAMERKIVRKFGIEELLEKTRCGNNCIHNTGTVVRSMVLQILQAGRGEPGAMLYLHGDSIHQEPAPPVAQAQDIPQPAPPQAPEPAQAGDDAQEASAAEASDASTSRVTSAACASRVDSNDESSVAIAEVDTDEVQPVAEAPTVPKAMRTDAPAEARISLREALCAAAEARLLLQTPPIL